MTAPVTALYAGVCGLLFLGLAGLVSLERLRERVDLGDGDREPLFLAIRVHGNFAEYVPLALLLMLVLEVNGTPVIALHGAGSALVLGRLLHAWGLSRTRHASPGRLLGILLTWAVILALALASLWRALG